jgi:transposase
MKSNKDIKYQTLQDNKTLNRHPEQVTDPLFQEHDFFDARDLIQVKYEMLRKVEREQWTVAKASKIFGFSRPSFYKTQHDFEQDGINGLISEKRGPKKAHKISTDIMMFIEKLMQSQRFPIQTIVKKVEENFNVTVHKRTIERAIEKIKKNNK